MKKVLFLVLVLAIVTACSQTRESYPDGFKLFVESVQKNAQNYTKADQKKVDEQFTKLRDSYNKFSERTTSNEKDKIVKLESTHATLKLKKIGNNLKKGAKDTFKKAKDTAKDAVKDVKEGAQKAMKKGEKAMERIKDGLKDQSHPTGLHVLDR